MKDNQILSTIVLVATCFSLNAQHNCGFDDHNIDKEHYIRSLKVQSSSSLREVKRFMIAPYIVSTPGQNDGLSLLELDLAMEQLNDLYAAADIEFVYCGAPTYIYDLKFSRLDVNTEWTTITNAEYNPNAINVYFIPLLYRGEEANGLCGVASFPNSNNKRAIFMRNSCVSNGSTYAHEFGHFFGLLHTHTTSFGGAEAVNGTNCVTAGDKLCDTPADPILSNNIVSPTCNYTGFESDFNGDRYTPDVTNLMSYSRKACRNYFSPGQLSIIRANGSSANSKYVRECVTTDVAIDADVIERDYKGNQLLSLPYTIENKMGVPDFDYDFDLVITIKDYRASIVKQEIQVLKASVLDYRGQFDYWLPANLSTGKYTIELEVQQAFGVEDIELSNNKTKVSFDIKYDEYGDKTVFFNPETKELTFYNNQILNRNFKVTVHNANGQMVYSQDEVKRGPDVINTYKLDGLASGIYFLTFLTEDEILDSFQFPITN